MLRAGHSAVRARDDEDLPGLTFAGWQERVGYLPALLDLLAFDLHREGSAPANAVAEAVRTLDAVAKNGRKDGTRTPYRTQHACRDAVVEFRELVQEAKGSLAKASTPEPFSTSKTSNWVAKVGGLPDYIQHVAHGILRSNPAIGESGAIERAIGVVKRWARGGGGVDKETQAAAAKAVAEWEEKKARSKANRAREADVNAKLLNAVDRLVHITQPIPDQATFAIRYGNRLSIIEGLLSSLSPKHPLAVRTARAVLEAPETASLDVLAEGLVARKQTCMILMEALGYGRTPIRARTAEKGKGKFHGMHGVERAVRKRTHAPDSGEEHPVLVAMNAGEKLREAELIEAVAPTLAPAPSNVSSAAFEQLHPRAAHGQFGAKGGAAAGAQGSGAGGGSAASGSALVKAVQAADPEFTKAGFSKDMAATAQYAASHPSGVTANAVNTAAQQIQNIGYDNSPSGISQFQKDEGIPVTGKMDDTTLVTVQSVYASNVKMAASRVPNFTGLPSGGARVGTSRAGRGGGAPGRKTLGKTSAKQINEAFGEVEEAEVYSGILFRPKFDQAGDESGQDRQPGGDDFDLDEIPRVPANFRDGEGVNRCQTCVHFSPAGWVTRAGVQGACMFWTYPVDADDLCDEWLTLTPPDATLKVFEARLAEAMESGDGFRIVEARAVLKVKRAEVAGVDPLDVHPADADLHALLVAEGTLTATGRKKIKGKNFAIPEDKAYPIHDESHARNALARSSGKPEEARVRAAVKKKYPHLVKDD